MFARSGLDLVDTHAHLDMEPLSGDQEGIVARARVAGVTQILTVGTDPVSSRRAVQAAERLPGVFAAVGIHPHDAANAAEEAYAELADLAAHPRVVAWGEIGLDLAKEYSPRQAQLAVFRRQLRFAAERALPVIIHDRQAHSMVLDVLAAESGGGGMAGVMHCFSGDRDVAARVLYLGLSISVTGVVTFPRTDALAEVVRMVPMERLMIETDCPFLSPVPFRGRPNEPARVVHVAEAVARIREMSLEEVARCTSANARALFSLPTP